jgi:hypothetical protein
MYYQLWILNVREGNKVWKECSGESRLATIRV